MAGGGYRPPCRANRWGHAGPIPRLDPRVRGAPGRCAASSRRPSPYKRKGPPDPPARTWSSLRLAQDRLQGTPSTPLGVGARVPSASHEKSPRPELRTRVWTPKSGTPLRSLTAPPTFAAGHSGTHAPLERALGCASTLAFGAHRAAARPRQGAPHPSTPLGVGARVPSASHEKSPLVRAFFERGRRDSNPQPPDRQSGALTSCATAPGWSCDYREEPRGFKEGAPTPFRSPESGEAARGCRAPRP